MIILRNIFIGATLFFLLTASSFAADNSNRIYGKITTADGDVFEGLIRWDKNEASWVDMLDGTKDLSKKNLRKSRSSRKRSRKSGIEIFGIKIGSSSTISFGNSAQSGLRFGHIKSFEVIGNNEILIQLKSGEEVELRNGSTDIGYDIREIIIEDSREGEIELEWDDIETIEFSEAATDEESSLGERLYGTLTTRRGDEFKGFVCWDVDEVLTTDVLNGEHKGRSKKIKFKRIEAIERYSSNGAVVFLNGGDELLLRGTNDVDDSNRGIIISDPDFGQVQVEWDEFDRVEFEKIPNNIISYDDFNGGEILEGTVYTEDGDSYTGQIRWDNDEEYSWEMLNGDYHNVEFDIEFSKIKEIKKKSYRSSIVTIRNGKSFRLRGSNDVDEDNKGIFIMTSDGDEVEVDWDEFDRVEFK